MIRILEWSFIITLSIVGSLIIFGFLIGFIERHSNSYIYSTFGKYGLVTYGILGTSTHEFSHLLMAKLFLHKIVEVKWFSLDINNRELGYVKHSYNKKNLYHRIGNFFIGTAPLIIGSLILILAYFLLLRGSFITISNDISINSFLNIGKTFNALTFIELLVHKFGFILQNTFTLSNFESINFWIFLFIAISISTHMSLSKADLRNSIDGIIFIFLASVFITVIFSLFNFSFLSLSFYLISFNVFLISFLCIGLFFSLFSLFISFLFFSIKSKILRL